MNLSNKQKLLVVKGVEKYKEIRQYIPEMIPFYPIGLPKFNGEWQCAGYRNAEKLFLIVWRMDSEQDEIKIPIKVDKANIIYGLADIGICSIFENNLSVKIREKYNALIIEC